MKKGYMDKIHTWGTVWNYAALLVMFIVPLGVSIAYKVWPDPSALGKVLGVLIPLYWTTAIIEVCTYVPMIGAGGTYLCFVTGNISNLKLPCGLNAMENAKVKPNTEEGEIICTISIGTSAITTTVIIAVGVLAFSPFLKTFKENPVAATAFGNVLPALFGALGASYFAKHWRIAVAPILIGVVFLLFAPSTQVGILMVLTIVVSVVGTLIIYKDLWKDLLKNRKKAEKA